MLFGWMRHADNEDARIPAPMDPRPNGTPPLPRPNPEDAGGELELPLLPILEKLPAELRSKMTKPASELTQARIFISVGRVLEQLPTGSVKITFGQLREAAPGLFSVGAEYDTLAVAVPLNEVLSRLNPKWLARSTAQKTVTIPDEITNPFSAPRKQVAPMSALRPISRLAAANSRIAPFQGTAPAATPAPEAPAIPRALSAVPAPAPTISPAATKPAPPPASVHGPVIVPLAALSEHWPDAMRVEITQSNLSGAQVALPFDMVQAALKRGAAIFSWRTLRAWIKPAPVAAVSVRDNLELSLPLKVIVPLFMAQSMQAVRKAQTTIPSANLPDLFTQNQQFTPAPVAKPVVTAAAPVTPVIAAPVTPVPVVSPVSAAPSPVVAPVVKPQQPVAAPAPVVPIPFSSAPAAPVTRAPVLAAAAPTQPGAAPVPNTPAAPSAAPQQPAAAPKPTVKTAAAQLAPAPITPFVRRATPADIVRRAMELAATAGAIVALPDGLQVASEVPDGVDADMLAAFVPQIFERAGQGVAELGMGELTSLTFTAGNVPWVIFRGSSVYFAVFGRKAGPLPTEAELAALAAELDRKKQN